MGRKVTIELVGGLGNQLFCYFAGLYISQIRECDLVPYKRKAAIGEIDHGSSIGSLLLKHKSAGFASFPVKLNKIVRQALHLALVSPIARSLGARDFSGFYSSTTLGFDPRLVEVTPGSYVRGYFQTYRYFDYLKEIGAVPKIGLLQQSSWFEEASNQIKLEQPLVMHVRRGDYLKPENSFIGALTSGYFTKALHEIRRVPGLENREVWIFSDDISSARAELENRDLGPHKWITPPECSDPAETLLLMGMGAGVVISNSTYSWWAAKLGTTKIVVAPSPWFMDHLEPIDLIPTDWLRVSSTWIDYNQ